jgi:hypothetical protein
MKRVLLALLFGSLAYGIALASAASIGTVTDAGLGAGNAVVAACDTDGVTTAYTTAYTTNVGYTVSSVSVAGINAACNTKAIQVTVAKSDGTVPSSGAGTVANGAASVAVSPATPASGVGNIYVEIG